MSNILAILRKELQIIFFTPLAYVVFTVFSFVSSFFFLRLLVQFQNLVVKVTREQPENLARLNFTDYVLVGEFFNIALLFIFVLPVISMRMIAEERRQGTLEWLMTWPVTSFQIAMGKYLALLSVVLVMTLLVTVYPLLVWAYSDVGGPAWESVLMGLCGLFLLGAAYVALGLFISALTRSQVVGWFLTWFVLMLLWAAGWAAENASGWLHVVLTEVSAVEHLRDFSAGVLNLKDVVYYFSIITLGFFFTQRALESQRWR